MEAASIPAGPAHGVRGFMRATSDERLVARLRAGDDCAFEVLYDRHHRGLLAFCRHMLGSQDEAEDVLQHVFMAVHRHIREDSRPLELKPWLYSVARNRCLSVLRSRRHSLPLDDVAEPSTDGLATPASVECREDLQQMLRDLAGLPDDQRAALLLSELHDLSHDEIAETLGVRREKVKALVFQARESLMSARRARETDCREIQEQLATLSGGALRRATLRRHVSMCPECAAFKAEMKRQKTALAAVLPVVPGVMLKDTVLASVLGGGGGAGTAVAAAGLTSAGGAVGSGLVAKGLTVAALAATAGGGGAVAVHEAGRDSERAAPKVAAKAISPRPAFVRSSAGAPARHVAASPRVPRAPRRPAKGAGRATPAPVVREAAPAAAPVPASRGSLVKQPWKTKPVAKARRDKPQVPSTAKPAHPAHPAHPNRPVKPQKAQKPEAPARAQGRENAPPAPVSGGPRDPRGKSRG
jgi:RNA polymerase sigma factor (sigma-70 family)